MIKKNKQSERFNEFLYIDQKDAPLFLKERIYQKVQKDLNPSIINILIKLVFIQSIVGFLTLLFCPQFSLSLTHNYELFHFFHRTLGHYGCMAVCAIIFIGTGALIAGQIMQPIEIRKIRSTSLLTYLAQSGVFISLFMLFGAKVYLDLALIWIFSATFGGTVFLLGSFHLQLLRKNLWSSN